MTPRWKTFSRNNSKQKGRYNERKRTGATTPRFNRISILRGGFIALGAVILIRLFTVQILHHNYYEALAFDNHRLFQELFPERGEIFVQDPYDTETGLYAIATNTTLAEVHAEPIHITDPQIVAEALSPILNIPKEDLLVKLDKPEDPDEILKRRVPEEVVSAIQDLQLPGITFREEQWRYYPEAETTASVTGYYGYSDEDKAGQYGLEGYFNEDLHGVPGELDGEKDAFGRFLTIGDSFIKNAIDGTDLELTIDKNVQFYACEHLNAAVEKFDAKGGSIIIMDPDTGAILAMCNNPTYDPNKYNEVETIDVFSNAAVTGAYEPGSVFKAFTMAAGLDLNVVEASTTYNDTGEVKIGKYTIRNSDGKSNGVQTMTEVLEKSLNTGTIFVTQQIGDEAFYQYLEKFGFGTPTGIELSNEHSGNIANQAKLKDIYTATASYGQGLTITPIQLISAYAAIANGGSLMKPYIVQKQVQPNGEVIETNPHTVRQVITEDTARVLTAMLVNVIDSGHAKLASVDGYRMAGKTGTAQIVGENGTYDANKHNDTFVGYGPISDPQFVMLTKLDQPTAAPWSAATAAPLFGEVAQYLMQYYHIAPDRE